MTTEAEYLTENRSSADIHHEVLRETRGRGWSYVEDGFMYHDDFGSVIRVYGWKDKHGHWRDAAYMLFPPAVGMGVDITKPYAGPYKTYRIGMKAAEAYYEGSDWAKIIARGGLADAQVPTGAYIEFRGVWDEYDLD